MKERCKHYRLDLYHIWWAKSNSQLNHKEKRSNVPNQYLGKACSESAASKSSGKGYIRFSFGIGHHLNLQRNSSNKVGSKTRKKEADREKIKEKWERKENWIRGNRIIYGKVRTANSCLLQLVGGFWWSSSSPIYSCFATACNW